MAAKGFFKVFFLMIYKLISRLGGGLDGIGLLSVQSLFCIVLGICGYICLFHMDTTPVQPEPYAAEKMASGIQGHPLDVIRAHYRALVLQDLNLFKSCFEKRFEATAELIYRENPACAPEKREDLLEEQMRFCNAAKVFSKGSRKAIVEVTESNGRTFRYELILDDGVWKIDMQNYMR